MSQVSNVRTMPVLETARAPRATSKVVTSPVRTSQVEIVVATFFAAWLVLFRMIEGLVVRISVRAETLPRRTWRTWRAGNAAGGRVESGDGFGAGHTRCPARSRTLAAGLLGAAVWLGVVAASLLGMSRGLP